MNQYRPHLLVLPEDDANRQLANGFLLHPAVDLGRIQVLAPAGGWLKVLDAFDRNQLGDRVGADETDRRALVVSIRNDLISARRPTTLG